MSSPYSTRYYEGLKDDSSASAKVLVPLILELLPARSVVDVGCGSGTWAREYLAAGCEVLAIDGHVVQPDQLLVPVERFQRANLMEPLRLQRRFDLVNCLEVAEHLDGSRADGLVADLCGLGDAVVFSAAVPGQGGTHHVNEQWQSYWTEKFRARGFIALDCLRPQVWHEDRVAWWYRQNLMVFIAECRAQDYPAARAAHRDWPVDLVHPRAYLVATVPREMSPRMAVEVLRALPYFPGKVAAHFRR